jgi:pteridine reductase
MNNSASPRTVLVTGGARRVGAAIVRSFAERGYHVVIHHGSSASEAEALAASLHAAHGTSSHIVQADLAEPDAPTRVVEEAARIFGRLDVIVSSASIMEMVPFDQVTPAQWMRTEAVNLRAPFFLLQAAARVLAPGGVFVQMADHLATEIGWPNLLPHQITKSALTQLVRAGADLLAPDRRVNAVAPGLVLPPDDMGEAAVEAFLRDVPLARAGSPDDVVQAIHALVDAPYITGVILPVDGGRQLRR